MMLTAPPQEYVNQEILSCDALSWLEQWGLDPLEPRYAGAGFIQSIIEHEEVSWDVKREIIHYLIDNRVKLDNEIYSILMNPFFSVVKSGDIKTLQLLLNKHELLRLIDKQYPLLKCLINWMEFQNEETALEILKLLKKNGAIINDAILFKALATCPISFVTELFQDISIAWTPKSALTCLLKVKEREEETFWEILKSLGWPLSTIVNREGKGALRIAIEGRKLRIVKWLVKQESVSILPTDIQAGWDCGDLEILECLIPPEEILKNLIDRKEALPALFQRFFLFSRLEKIREYIPPLNIEILCQEYLYHAALISRQTRDRLFVDSAKNYDFETQKFVHNQMEFGKICHEAVMERLQAFKRGEKNLFLAFENFMQTRHRIATLRSEDSENYFIEFRTQVPDAFNFTSFGSLFRFPSRYSFAIPWIRQIMDQDNSEEFEKNENGYTLYYLHPETQNRHPLTRIDLDNHLWVHTSLEELGPLCPILEKMHEELLAMEIDIRDPSQVQFFQDKIAKAYWLGCNLMITMRGNAQYFLMWLSAILQYHGFDPLLAKKETPMPDCLALSVPLSNFIALFPSIFENPLFAEGQIQIKLTRLRTNFRA